MSIKFYKTNEMAGFCSNFYKSKMYIYDNWFPTVEHAYQYKKTFDPKEQEEIKTTKKASDVRLVGQKVKLRPDWDEVKYDIMKECCIAKFLQNKDLAIQLLATGDEELVEDSPVDYYWGIGSDGSGKNMLGKVLGEVRSIIKSSLVCY